VAYKESVDIYMRLGLRDGGVAKVGALLWGQYSVLFGTCIAVNIELFLNGESTFRVLVLVPFHMEKDWLHGPTCPCCLANCEIDIPVVGSGVIRLGVRGREEILDILNYSGVVAETLK